MYLDGDIVCLMGPMNGIVVLQNNCQIRRHEEKDGRLHRLSQIGQEDVFMNHGRTEEEMDLEVVLW